ncbi:MAG TPA: hypothetical protein VHM89_13665 [Acidimicrobiales bacterium]|nr:hypothetical protein [Acidimicrobiales bacterium]
MPSATSAGVFVLADASALPSPPPPGVSLVRSGDVPSTARSIALALGADACLTIDEAAAVLEARRAAAVETAMRQLRDRQAAVAAAHVATERARPGLSTVPAGLSAATVRSAAHTVAEAVESLAAAREAVGIRPGYDDGWAAVARAAQAEIDQARVDRANALPRANRALTAANVGAGLVVVGRVASEAFDGPFVAVAVLPVVGLGYAAHAVIAPARRARTAARRRWAALRSMNVSTLAGLAALEDRARAWERRAARVKAAEADFRAARDGWRSLVGDAVSLASAERLAVDLERALETERTMIEASAAWVEAAAELQVAEDTAPAGAPMVVLHPGRVRPGDDDEGPVRLLAELAGATPVVLVAQERVPRLVPDLSPPPPATKVPAPVGAGPARGGSDGGGIVDLREKLKAGLLRLRTRPASPRDASPPGSIAAEG